MLKIIETNNDDYIKYIGDDPVRPNIPIDKRVGQNQKVFVLCEDEKVQAITCVSFNHLVPEDEHDLFNDENNPNVAVFYTIWSYVPGKARDLLFDVVNYIEENLTNISRFVTLSPKTEMARKFHIRNGAVVFRENDNTINYEYIREKTRV